MIAFFSPLGFKGNQKEAQMVDGGAFFWGNFRLADFNCKGPFAHDAPVVQASQTTILRA